MDTIETKLSRTKAMDYLLQLDIVRKFIQDVTGVSMPVDILEFQEYLRSGVYLAQLVRILSRQPDFAIFDENHQIFKARGVHYKHIDNIQIFLKYLRSVTLPNIFHPDVQDIYEKKNTAKLLYCLRALMYHIGYKLECGTPKTFPDDVINQVSVNARAHDFSKLRKYPCTVADAFDKFEEVLGNDDFDTLCDIIKSLVDIIDLNDFNVHEMCLLYFEEVKLARASKREPLTPAEIVEILKKQSRVYLVTHTLQQRQKAMLLTVLGYDTLLESRIKPAFATLYFTYLDAALRAKKDNKCFNYVLTHGDIVDAVEEANRVGQVQL